MTKDYPGEKWKEVKFDFKYVNTYRLFVSNLGRVKASNSLYDGRVLNGSMINGYAIVRLKFFKKKDPATEAQLIKMRAQVARLTKQVKSLKESKAGKKAIAEASEKLSSLRKTLAVKSKSAEKARTIYYHSLIHRLIATYFVKRPSKAHSVVAHMDFKKLNNKASNLKWMTPEENYRHQLKSPYVIAEKIKRHTEPSASSKLTIKKVMQLKKLLNQDKPIRTLARQFGVSDTQILRIKRGINWGKVKAAK